MNRRLWLDTRGTPVISTTRNGENNAVQWGWTPATARPLPTREQLADTIWDALEEAGWVSTSGHYPYEIADVVLALLKGQDT